MSRASVVERTALSPNFNVFGHAIPSRTMALQFAHHQLHADLPARDVPHAKCPTNGHVRYFLVVSA